MTVFDLKGTPLKVTTPPTAWEPEKATDAEIARFGLPPRPKDEMAQRMWLRKFGGDMRPVAPTGMCDTGRVFAPEGEPSENWAGTYSPWETDEHNYYFSADAQFTQPRFDAVCPSASEHSIWAGLGGSNPSQGLIQNGTNVDSAGDGPNVHYFWWETLLPNIKPEDQPVPGTRVRGMPIGQGAQVEVDSFYQRQAKQIYFTFANYSQRRFMVLDPWSSISGHKASEYYNGDSAEGVAVLDLQLQAERERRSSDRLEDDFRRHQSG